MIEEEIWGWRFPYHHNNNIPYPIIRVLDLKNYEPVLSISFDG